MLNNKTIAVVVPAYNEERQIAGVLETMPAFVDRIVVVNDASVDGTEAIVRKYIGSSAPGNSEIRKPAAAGGKYNKAERVFHKAMEKERKHLVPAEMVNQTPEQDRIILINNLENGGVGASIAQGYQWCMDYRIDCTAVMAGDGQMDPSELESIVMPVVDQDVDYVKGNRLIHRSAWLIIPKVRYFGNSILSILTKIASGYWRISDTQCGYTAISLKALMAIRLHHIYRGYGMPNDLLVKLNIAFCTIKEVEIKPVYRVGETSKMNILKVMPRIALLLLLSFFKRLWVKYLFRDFHPLFLLYNFAIVLILCMQPYFIKIAKAFWRGAEVSFGPLLLFTFLAITAFQSLLFAMWMDIQDNERLYK